MRRSGARHGRVLVLLMLAGWLCGRGCLLAASPNIVVIYADDLGYGDVQCYNPERGKIPTPNIDRLASEGMRFTDAYAACCVCSPTRVSLLTGKNPARLHITHAIPIQGYLRLKGPLPQLLGGSVAYWARLADMAGDGIHFAESIVVQASGRPRRPTAMRHELPLHPSGFAE